jgi:hypothetical protein
MTSCRADTSPEPESNRPTAEESSLEPCQPIARVHWDRSVDRFPDDGGNRHLPPVRFGAQPAHLLLSQRNLYPNRRPKLSRLAL